MLHIGEMWLSLRLDGTGFSKYIPRLKRAGLLEGAGYSAIFADIMQEVVRVHILIKIRIN